MNDTLYLLLSDDGEYGFNDPAGIFDSLETLLETVRKEFRGSPDREVIIEFGERIINDSYQNRTGKVTTITYRYADFNREIVLYEVAPIKLNSTDFSVIQWTENAD